MAIRKTTTAIRGLSYSEPEACVTCKESNFTSQVNGQCAKCVNAEAKCLCCDRSSNWFASYNEGHCAVCAFGRCGCGESN